MSRPTTRLCVDCLPTALRTRGAGGPLLLPATAPPRRGISRRVQIAEQRRGLQHVPGCRVLRPTTSGNVKTGLAGPGQHVRQLATVGEGEGEKKDTARGSRGVPEDGPLKEYENRIAQGRLRNDPHQRSMCTSVIFGLIWGVVWAMANSECVSLRYHREPSEAI